MPSRSLNAAVSVFRGLFKHNHTHQNGNIKYPTKSTSPTCCPICQDLSPDLEALDHNYDAPKIQSEVIKSAKRGCAGCSVLVAVLAPYAAKCTDKHRSNECTWMYWKEYDTLTLLLDCHRSHASEQRCAQVKLYTLTESTFPWKLLKSTPVVSRDTESENAFTSLKDWMHECASSHASCKRFLGPSMLPRRVVEILGPQTTRLRETSNEYGKYICLSYCWGGIEPLKTTRGSLDAHKASIPWDALTQTFQQAVDIAYRLKIRYLWIDSLCILQGDKDDWRREGSKMYEVYSNAYLTIAATHSKNPSGGCYRVSDFRTGQTYTFQNPQGQRYEVHAREPLAHINDYEILDEHSNSFPLLQRAWAYQERMLSPRMVHFGPNELLWECVESKTCECGHWPGYGARPHEYYSEDLPLYFEKPHLKMDNTPTEFGTLAITSPAHWKWRRVVEQYTNRSLTNGEDIFPALQGVAKSIQRGSEYCAGLWKDESLFIDLLWHGRYEAGIDFPQVVQCAASDPEGRDYGDCLERWRAPTWSWASGTRPVAFTTPVHETTEILASVADIQTDHFGDPFGQLRSGVLKLRGRCVDAVLGNNRVTPDVYHRYSPIRHSHSGDEVETAQTLGDNFLYLQFKRNGAVSTSFPSSSSDETDLREFGFEPDYNLDSFFDRTVRLMEMLRWQRRRNWAKDAEPEHHYTYLVFICVDEKREVYERIGFLDNTDRAEPEHFVNNGEVILVTVV